MNQIQKISLRNVVAALGLPVFRDLSKMMALGYVNFDHFIFGEGDQDITGLEYMQEWTDTKSTYVKDVQDYWTNEKYGINLNEPYYALNLGVSVLYFKMSSTGLLCGKVIIRTPGEYARHPVSDLAIEDPVPKYVFAVRDPDTDTDTNVLVDGLKARSSLIAGTDLHKAFCVFMDVIELIISLKQLRTDGMTPLEVKLSTPIKTTLVFAMGSPNAHEEVRLNCQAMSFPQADSVHRLMSDVIYFLANNANREVGDFYSEFILKKAEPFLNNRGPVIQTLMSPVNGVDFKRYMVYQDNLDDSGGVTRLHQKSCDSLIEALAYNFANSYHGILISDSSDPSGWREMDNNEIANELQKYF